MAVDPASIDTFEYRQLRWPLGHVRLRVPSDLPQQLLLTALQCRAEQFRPKTLMNCLITCRQAREAIRRRLDGLNQEADDDHLESPFAYDWQRAAARLLSGCTREHFRSLFRKVIQPSPQVKVVQDFWCQWSSQLRLEKAFAVWNEITSQDPTSFASIDQIYHEVKATIWAHEQVQAHAWDLIAPGETVVGWRQFAEWWFYLEKSFEVESHDLFHTADPNECSGEPAAWPIAIPPSPTDSEGMDTDEHRLAMDQHHDELLQSATCPSEPLNVAPASNDPSTSATVPKFNPRLNHVRNSEAGKNALKRAIRDWQKLLHLDEDMNNLDFLQKPLNILQLLIRLMSLPTRYMQMHHLRMLHDVLRDAEVLLTPLWLNEMSHLQAIVEAAYNATKSRDWHALSMWKSFLPCQCLVLHVRILMDKLASMLEAHQGPLATFLHGIEAYNLLFTLLVNASAAFMAPLRNAMAAVVMSARDPGGKCTWLDLGRGPRHGQLHMRVLKNVGGAGAFDFNLKRFGCMWELIQIRLHLGGFGLVWPRGDKAKVFLFSHFDHPSKGMGSETFSNLRAVSFQTRTSSGDRHTFGSAAAILPECGVMGAKHFMSTGTVSGTSGEHEDVFEVHYDCRDKKLYPFLAHTRGRLFFLYIPGQEPMSESDVMTYFGV